MLINLGVLDENLVKKEVKTLSWLLPALKGEDSYCETLMPERENILGVNIQKAIHFS
jgi:hypothetical protein